MHRHSNCGRPAMGRVGFTLVELLVVIGIIVVLVGILLPVLSTVRERSNRVKCMSNLHTLGVAMVMYANSYRDRLPNSNPPNTAYDYDAINAVLVAFARDQVRGPAVFHCPSDRDPVPTDILSGDYVPTNSARISYDFYSVFWMPEYGPKLTKIKDAPLAWDLRAGDPNPHPDQNHGSKGGHVVYGDGHVDWQATKQWDAGNWPHPATQYYLYR